MVRSIDPLDLWKIGSIALTGAFGVLGLLTEYKHPESKRVTFWGYISLAGIILSTVASVIAQTVEVSRSKVSEQEKSAQALALAQNTATAVRNTSDAVKQIRRVLSPLGSSTMILRFEIPCRRSSTYRAFCRQLWKSNAPPISRIANFPGGRPGGVDLGVSFQPEGPDRLATQYSGTMKRLPADDDYLNGTSDNGIDPNDLSFFVRVRLKQGVRHDIAIKSIYDLLDEPVFVWLTGNGYEHLVLTDVWWQSERGDVIEAAHGPFTPAPISDQTYQYEMKFGVSKTDQVPY